MHQNGKKLTPDSVVVGAGRKVLAGRVHRDGPDDGAVSLVPQPFQGGIRPQIFLVRQFWQEFLKTIPHYHEICSK